VNNAGLGEPLVLQSLGLYESIIPNNFFFFMDAVIYY
jgi:hypothetical protein